MSRSWSLSAKLGAIGGALLLVAFASIGLTLWVTWQLEGGAAAVNEAGRMRMQIWRMAHTLTREDPQQMVGLAAKFDQSLDMLRTGDPARPLLVPHDGESQRAFAAVQRDWSELRPGWTALPGPGLELSARQADAFVASIDTFVSAIEQQLSRLTGILYGVQFLMVALTLASA
ncbi:MAG: type IV pili methyl-accepting chemotaxis transducer N-terminal domain-containing protein, partial [Rubrivivax sp.]|nr:type IV pili methyl-accepting chemotaxis transducer N-terminal domain-containing protein [Rubrivivax sp.]